jgi:hypothetical protein
MASKLRIQPKRFFVKDCAAFLKSRVHMARIGVSTFTSAVHRPREKDKIVGIPPGLLLCWCVCLLSHIHGQSLLSLLPVLQEPVGFTEYILHGTLSSHHDANVDSLCQLLLHDVF